jgi:hypothetical protein
MEPEKPEGLMDQGKEKAKSYCKIGDYIKEKNRDRKKKGAGNNGETTYSASRQTREPLGGRDSDEAQECSYSLHFGRKTEELLGDELDGDEMKGRTIRARQGKWE